MISIVIPIHNEEPAILPLYDRLTTVLEAMNKPTKFFSWMTHPRTAASNCWQIWWRPMAA